MITIMDAVKYYGGHSFVKNEQCAHHTHIVSATGVNLFYSAYASDIDGDSAVCTIKDYNSLVSQLSSNFGRMPCGLLSLWQAGVEAESVTPVFTKEFKVKGGTCETWQACKIVFVGKKYTVVENESGKEFSRKTAKITIRDIDTRTDKEKAIDEAYRSDLNVKENLAAAYDKWVGE